MAKIIIGIHGLGNKPPADTLEKWWLKAIDEGLRNLSEPNHPKLKFKMVYWADILHKKPLDEFITDKEDPYYLNEPYQAGSKDIVPEDHTVRKKILDLLTKELNKVFLNEDFSINYSFITDAIVKKYFTDLDAYYTEDCNDENDMKCSAKDKIRERLKNMILAHKNDQIFLIAHSMGSIIAFDVLSYLPKNIQINTFVTIGSPLGLPIIISKIAAELKQNHLEIKKPEVPLSIKQWYNFSDIEDKIAINYKLADDFMPNKYGVQIIDREIINDYKINNHRNPHKSYGYLRSPELSNLIYTFLKQKETVPLMRILQSLKKILSIIKYNFKIKHDGPKSNAFKHK